MSKGDNTRQRILDQAYAQATRLGLEGLTLGKLAEELGMSKSGVFAHFRSREDLQLAVLELASQRFVLQVLQPALKEPRGLPRLQAVVKNWFALAAVSCRACLFISGSSEYDDRPGALKEALQEYHNRWRQDLARAVTQAIDKGQLHEDTDPQQVAFEIYSLVLGLHHDARLFGDPGALHRAERALDKLLKQQEVGVR